MPEAGKADRKREKPIVSSSFSFPKSRAFFPMRACENEKSLLARTRPIDVIMGCTMRACAELSCSLSSIVSRISRRWSSHSPSTSHNPPANISQARGRTPELLALARNQQLSLFASARADNRCHHKYARAQTADVIGRARALTADVIKCARANSRSHRKW